MTITFYNNTSENSRIDKTNYLEEVLSIEGTLRDSCSVTTPIIQVQHVDFFNANYAYIPEFNRYYFITDIVSVRTYLWEIHMSVDVLMSFKDQITSLKGYVGRWEGSTNKEIFDERRRFNSIPTTITTKLQSVPWANYDEIKSSAGLSFIDYPWFVVVCDTEEGYIGGDSSSGYHKKSIKYNTSREDLLSCNSKDLFSTNYIRIYICTRTSFLGWLAESTTRGTHIVTAYVLPNPKAYVNGAVNPDFIKMCGGSTGDTLADIAVSEIKIGQETFAPSTGDFVFEVQSPGRIDNVYFESFQITSTTLKSYMRAYPYEVNQLYIPMYGVIDIPDTVRFQSPIALNTILDLTTGIYSCSLTYYRGTTSIPITVFDAFECPKIPLTYNGSVEYIRQKTYNNMVMSLKALDFGSGLVNNLISIGTGIGEAVLSKSPISGLSNAASGAGGIATSGFDIASMFIQADAMELINVKQGHTISISSSYSTYQLSPYVTTLITTTYTATEPNDPTFAKLYGLPFYRVAKLNMKGFFTVSNVHLENVNCLEEERTIIKQLLSDGVIG